MLRAIASVMILFHHAYPHYEAMGGKIAGIHFISQWGFIGVDIFFVISGFIMAYTTFNKERTKHNAGVFLKHRLFRIYLGYWPFFFIMLAALYITNPSKLSSLDLMGSFFLANVDMFKLVLPVSWSLSYELYFYFLFLFTFLFSVKQLYLLIPFFILLTVSLVLLASYKNILPESFFYSPFLLEFFSGVLLYMYKEYLMKIWLLPLALLAIALAYRYGTLYDINYGLNRVLGFGTGALFIVLAFLILEAKGIYRAGKWLETLGNASYTLYLSHLIIIQLFYFTGLRRIFTSDGTLLPLLGFLFLLSFSLVFSLVYYYLVEKPLYQKAINYGRIL